MRTLIFVIVITFLFLSSGLAYDLEEYYPLNKGDTWTYSKVKDGVKDNDVSSEVLDKEVIKGINTVKRTFPGYDFEWVAIDSEGIKKYKESSSSWEGVERERHIYNPPLVISPNIEIGESKEYELSSTVEIVEDGQVQQTRVIKGSVMVSLDSVEDVQVPAGEFTDCLKFVSIYTYEDSDGTYGQEECARWLAPGLGEVKINCAYSEYSSTGQENNTLELELVSASVGGKTIGSR